MFLSKVKSALGRGARAVGGILRKVGDLSSGIVSKIDGVRQLYNAANAGTGGVLGNLLEAIPGVGTVKKAIDTVGGVSGMLKGAQRAARGVADVGSKIEGAWAIIDSFG